MSKARTPYQRSRKKKKLFNTGNIIILTDGKKTEPNYFNGIIEEYKLENIQLRNIDPHDLIDNRDKFIEDLQIEERKANEFFLVIDIDEIKNFDQIVKDLESKGIEVIWSNPCIEVWFSYYLGLKIDVNESKSYQGKFSSGFLKKTGREYKKKDRHIYKVLKKYGNEEEAIRKCKSTYTSKKRHYENPTEMIRTSLVFKLVEKLVTR